MKEFRERVAVVTGAASGIGRALAGRCAREGMKVVLADVEQPALMQAEAELRVSGADVLAVSTDVSQPGAVEALAEQAWNRFGGVHLLCNNAGVARHGPLWQLPLADWEWVIGVNLWGVIHGVRSFIPRMLAQGTECHVVNTASVVGLLPGWGVYGITKHAVVAFSEALAHDLAQQRARIGVSVLCPGFVQTRIADAARNRPPGAGEVPPLRPEDEAALQWIREQLEAGMSPDRVAECVFEAVREERFCILTHPAYQEAIQARLADLLEGRQPPGLHSLVEPTSE